jgi:tRNA threonylcarbamoyladenosine biosynthesis protein TsaB
VILAIETASETGGVALVEGGRVLGERQIGGHAPRHAAELLATLDALLAELGRSLEEVDPIALSIGPGSFTGLRIGLATALGLCFGTDRQIVPVPTLAALSTQAGDVEPIVSLLDARKGQVYGGRYRAGGACLVADAVCDPLPLFEELRQLRGSEPIWLIGPGARLYQNEIRTALGGRAQLAEDDRNTLRASSVGLLGERLAGEGAAQCPTDVQLRYLRAAEAEEKRAAGHRSGQPIS